MKLRCTLLAFFCTSLLGFGETPPVERFSIENMDRNVDPGTDFYRFANGGWLKKHEIPDDQVTWSPTTQLVNRNLALLRELVESCTETKADRTPEERLVGDFYAAAINSERAEQLKFEPISPDLKRISELRSKEEFADLIADLHERGVNPLFDASVTPDARNSTIYALELTQGGIGLPDRDYYFGEKFAAERAAYREHIPAMLRMLGDSDAVATEEMKAVLAIETALAKASRQMEDLSDPIANYHKLTLAELEKLTPSFRWRRYLDGVHSTKLDTVIVGQPEFFKAVEGALKKYSLDEWKAYLRWHVVTATAPLLHSAAEQESFAFFGTKLNGQPKIDPRWKRSLRRVDSNLGEALGKLYVDRYFPAASQQRMKEMVENITGVYRERLAKVPWMTEETRKRAVEKFDHFTTKIGAPAKLLDYTSIEIRRDDYVGNVQRASVFESRRQMGRIGQQVDRTEWEMTPPTVNAYFNPPLNEIVFPAGILQPPFFDPEMDDAVNYGATGATIGHEMTHGYDNEGRKYDENGNLRDWWKKADAREFDTRAQKLVKQFNSYEALHGLHVNGKLTLAENIADLGGLSIAYEALQRALEKDPSKRKTIDGFTPEQRFFISYAQSWASKEREAYLRRALTTDSHSPDRLRAFAPLTNLQEFFDAFGIKENAPLWRPKAARAVIW
ncbi:M13 family metallopeptidase [Verrucomicrobiota bacterium sgz303538]